MNNCTPYNVFLNSIALYIKLFITVVVGLYLTRIVLNRLGVEDYGIYNLIGGVISLLSFIQTALSVSTQRYLSVSMGKGNQDLVNRVFASSYMIHIVLSIAILVIFELCSLFLFNGFLNIPSERVFAAKVVYHIMVASTVFTVIQVPFTACMTAHEDLWLLAIIETVSALLKLVIIFLFDWCSMDAIIIYSLWICVVTLMSAIPKLAWSIIKYSECKLIGFRYLVKKDTVKEMLGFTGWNALGTLALVGRNQGVAILQNLFFGPAINAVYGIANQVSGQLVYCSQVMTTSISPQIMKSEGEGNRIRMIRLSVFASKVAFLISSAIALPLIIEIDTILKFWLQNVPEYTQIYCILTICMFLVMQLYPGLNRAVQALGKIKSYQIVTSLLLLSPIPIGYIMYKMGVNHTGILYTMIISQVLQMIYTIWYLNKYVRLSMIKFYLFVFRALGLFFLMYYLGSKLHLVLELHTSILITFCVTTVFVSLIYLLLTYFAIFDRDERDSILNTLKSLVIKC